MRNCFVITLAVSVGMALACATAGAAVLPVFEDFSVDAGDLTLSETFSVGSGTLNHVETNVRTERTADVQVTDAAGESIRMSMTVSAGELATGSDVGFVAFATSHGSSAGGYVADFKPSGAMRILYGATWEVIATPALLFDYDPLETYELTFVAEPNGANLDLTFTLDDPSSATGPVSVSGTTTGTSNGQYFGVRTRSAGWPLTDASFDDFSIVSKLPGDADGDWVVDEADAAVLASHWLQQTGAEWADGDFNEDGRVDAVDATIMAANWGVSWNASSAAAVPEPSALAALAGLLAMLFVRRMTRR